MANETNTNETPTTGPVGLDERDLNERRQRQQALTSRDDNAVLPTGLTVKQTREGLERRAAITHLKQQISDWRSRGRKVPGGMSAKLERLEADEANAGGTTPQATTPAASTGQGSTEPGSSKQTGEAAPLSGAADQTSGADNVQPIASPTGQPGVSTGRTAGGGTGARGFGRPKP